jgi:amino acid adenylation domain-containing protein
MLPLSVYQLFDRAAIRFPESIAVEELSSHMTYSELKALTERISDTLLTLENKPEEVISVVLPSGAMLVASLLACQKTQLIYMPMDLKMSSARLSKMLRDTGSTVIITNHTLKNDIIELASSCGIQEGYILVVNEDMSLSVIDILTGAALSATRSNPLHGEITIEKDSSAYIFYTSGSVSEGKPILGRQESLSHFIQWEIHELGIANGCRIAQIAQITFDASLKDILTAVCSGATLCIAPREDFNALSQWIVTRKINVIQCVPSIFRMVLRAYQEFPEVDLSEVKIVVLAGEMLFARDISNWRKTAGSGAQIINMYGATESTILTTFNKVADIPADLNTPMPIGMPIWNTSVAVIKGDRLCKVGEIGELYVKTPYLTKGYYKRPDLTNTIFVQNPLQKDKQDIVYKSGDLARYLEGGKIEIVGRADDVVKINGVRVDLHAISNHLKGLDVIDEVVIVQHSLSADDKTLVCYYSGQKMSDELLAGHLAKDVDINLIPGFFIYVEEWPRNLNGKLDKKALPKPSIKTRQLAPVGETENALAAIWKEVLQITDVGRSDSFFALGGHSIKAIQLISRISKVFGGDLSLGQIFENKTIRDQAMCIDSFRKKRSEVTLMPQVNQCELSHAQMRLWFMNLITDARAFNIVMAFDVKGVLDIGYLEHAFRETIKRHEILRTNFFTLDGVPRQRISDANVIQFSIPVKSLHGDDDFAASVSGAIREATNHIFDLESGLLIHVNVIKSSDSSLAVILCIHHLVADAWSMGVLLKEVVTLYNALYSNTTIDLKPLGYQYRHYVQQQREYISSPQLEEDRQFWLTRFRDFKRYAHFPYDFERPGIRTFAGASITFHMSAALSSQIKAYCAGKDISIFMAVMTAVKLLLQRINALDDITIGTTVVERSSLNAEDQIGFYVNTMAIRTRFTGHESLGQVSEKVRQSVVESFKHQHFPFDKLVEGLKLPRTAGAAPLFGILLEVLNTDVHQNVVPLLHGASFTRIHVDAQIAQYDLALRFIDDDSNLQLLVEYNTDLYKPETIQLINDLLQQVFGTLITNEQMKVSELSLISELQIS